jgi:hypothetical protein
LLSSLCALAMVALVVIFLDSLRKWLLASGARPVASAAS